MYFELADLLLQQAQTGQSSAWLKQAIETIESMKMIELQDYFQDDCVIQGSLKRSLLEEVEQHTAVLYPILLDQRVELLLNLPNGTIKQFKIDVTFDQLKTFVNEFRFELETGTSGVFMPYAQQLYQWLIAPFAHLLQAFQIDTLVIVPDGILRTIPFAAFHDGKQFLIENYAVAVTPGITLTASPATQPQTANILLNGLADSVQNYPALEGVHQEIEQVAKIYPKQQATILFNQAFTTEKFSQTVKNTPYSIIHIASHGQFDSEPQRTFLLTYDNKLTMNQLESLIRLGQNRKEPVDLLTLSACQTAVGDDQAALGLAGIALKAGARSALASLWLIDDQATTLLIREFYRHLQIAHQSKGKALQAAQKYLLQQSRYQHPVFWAPFLLIGNWQ